MQSNGILEGFRRTLLDEHFRVEGRRTWFESIEEIQAVLNEYLEGYNTKRPHQGRGMNGRTPIRAFTEGMQKTSNTEATSQTKTPDSKPPDACFKCGLCQEVIVGVDIAQDRPAESRYGK